MISLSRAQRQQLFQRRLIHLFFLLLSASFLLPLLLIISASFSTDKDITTYGYSLIPHHLTLAAYQYLFSDPSQLLGAYGVSIFVTIVGGCASLLVMALLAY